MTQNRRSDPTAEEGRSTRPGVLDKRFTAPLQKEPGRGGWTPVVMSEIGRVLRDPRARQGLRDHRRSPVP